MSDADSRIVLTDAPELPKGRADGRCPRCRASRERRVPSGGFGDRHDVCGQCGHEFDEWTLG